MTRYTLARFDGRWQVVATDRWHADYGRLARIADYLNQRAMRAVSNRLQLAA